MLSDDELLDLPADPESAFVVFHNKILERTEPNINEANWDAEREYMLSLFAFCDAYNLEYFKDYREKYNRGTAPGEIYSRLKEEAKSIILRLRLIDIKKQKDGLTSIIKINPPTREKIHFHIDKIREKLNEIDLTENKRDSLFKKLNAFAAEVDRNRTRLDALMSMTLEVADTGGEAAKNSNRFGISSILCLSG